jgi:hypothetical protein
MGQTKRQQIDLLEHLEGTDSCVALAGGYLYIFQDDALIHIASIPSPNLLADRSSDSVIENVDEFVDENGNEFVIVIFSSITGIDWHLAEYPDDTDLLMRMHYDVRLNED